MEYTIETKQTSTLKGIKLFQKKDVINTIKMFDLKPPFKIYDEGKNNVTLEFLSLLEKEGYVFIDVIQVAKKLPAKLKKVMNENYKRAVKYGDKKEIKFVTENDIKSIKGFFELWEKKCITIGTEGSKCIVYNTVSKTIDLVEDIKDPDKSKVLDKSFDEFISKLKINES